MKLENRCEERKTDHRTAASKPEARRLIAELKRHWESWDVPKRGDRLAKLVSLGCSIRGLARDLDSKPTTIDTYIKLASLSEDEREELRAGQSQRKMLARKAKKERQRGSNERRAEERRTGRLSDGVAEIILKFWQSRGEVPGSSISPSAVPELLNGVRLITRGELRAIPPSAIKLPRNFNSKDLFDLTKPPEPTETPWVHGEHWMGHRERWLAIVLMSIAPEPFIRERAMNKAEKRACQIMWRF